MSKDKQSMSTGNNEPENKDLENIHISQSDDLSDEQRVKILSPSMLVFRRFIRNKLAVIGIFFIVGMFLFSFLGGAVSRYGEAEQFYRSEPMFREYAGVVDNSGNPEYRYTIAENVNFNTSARARFILAINNGETSFSYNDETFTIQSYNESTHGILSSQRIATALNLPVGAVVTPASDDIELSEEFITAFSDAIANGESNFEYEDSSYLVSAEGKQFVASSNSPIVIASYNVIDFDEIGQTASVPFAIAAERAYAEVEEGGTVEFEAGGETYVLALNDDSLGLVYTDTVDGDPIASISPIIINQVSTDVHIDLAFRARITEAIDNGETSFTYDGGRGEEEFRIERQNFRYTVNNVRQTRILDTYHYPDSNHWLGTDGNGMDLLTRLMYGGRVSLTIGFIVVALALLIGVTLGGIAGYFGGWIDNAIMRLVDVFYCIPTYPILIILGSMMDELRLDSQVRMGYLMLLLGILSWAGIARLVRGQILSLREQEFMVAAEATGISVGRRIFRHLIPNVIPQLIVIATQALGGTILTEATLSFLGLGVKYPFASWGNIINAVSTLHVMTTYWFVWIPAGICILITVLGFNFIGDGLRDAFDPKMKR